MGIIKAIKKIRLRYSLGKFVENNLENIEDFSNAKVVKVSKYDVRNLGKIHAIAFFYDNKKENRMFKEFSKFVEDKK